MYACPRLQLRVHHAVGGIEVVRRSVFAKLGLSTLDDARQRKN